LRTSGNGVKSSEEKDAHIYLHEILSTCRSRKIEALEEFGQMKTIWMGSTWKIGTDEDYSDGKHLENLDR
jgi:hypothetical protein